LLNHLPEGGKLDIDIVCHSRGGLVARELAERAAGGTATSVNVRRIVFAGVPNAGTLLADRDHMVSMIDRLTTITNMFPIGPVTEFLEGLITAVKVLGHAGLAGLPGLAAMDPHGKFLKSLNTKADVSDTVYGIAADYEPTDAGLRALITGTADAVMDRIFENAPNDLVVPQLGVFEKNGGSSFPIPPAQVLKIDKAAGVMHTTLFGYRPACDKILEWLGAP
jgi:pimeloyl-ACP methyl ester carboxylesterase